MIIKYTVRLEYGIATGTNTFVFELEEIEKHGLAVIMEIAIEKYMKDIFCTCSFSESHNHRDCLMEYDEYRVINREVMQEDNE